jgi:hypothetical protein
VQARGSRDKVNIISDLLLFFMCGAGALAGRLSEPEHYTLLRAKAFFPALNGATRQGDNNMIFVRFFLT